MFDNLQWALLLFSGGYTALELFMSLLARQRRFSYKVRDNRTPLLATPAVLPTLPAERLASTGSRFARLHGVHVHFKFAPAARALVTNSAASDDVPLIVMLPGVGNCAETCIDVANELRDATGLSVAVMDRVRLFILNSNRFERQRIAYAYCKIVSLDLD